MSSLGFWALSNDCIETVMLVLLWVFQSFLSLFDGSLKIFFFFFKLSETKKKSYICPKFNELKKSRKLGFCLESQEVPVGPHQKDSAGGGEVRILGFWSSDVISTKAKYSEFLSSVMSDRRRNSQSSAFAVVVGKGKGQKGVTLTTGLWHVHRSCMCSLGLIMHQPSCSAPPLDTCTSDRKPTEQVRAGG